MANLTIALDDHIVKLARLRAVQDGTSVSAQVRAFLERYAQGQDIGATTASAPVTLPVFAGKGGMRSDIDPCSNQSMLAATEGKNTL